jgi:hypothetical protein
MSQVAYRLLRAIYPQNIQLLRFILAEFDRAGPARGAILGDATAAALVDSSGYKSLRCLPLVGELSPMWMKALCLANDRTRTDESMCVFLPMKV